MAFIMAERRPSSVLLLLINDFWSSSYIRKILKADVEVLLEIQQRDHIPSQSHSYNFRTERDHKDHGDKPPF